MHAVASSRLAALPGPETPGWLAYRPRGQPIATAIAKTGRPEAGLAIADKEIDAVASFAVAAFFFAIERVPLTVR